MQIFILLLLLQLLALRQLALQQLLLQLLVHQQLQQLRVRQLQPQRLRARPQWRLPRRQLWVLDRPKHRNKKCQVISRKRWLLWACLKFIEYYNMSSNPIGNTDTPIIMLCLTNPILRRRVANRALYFFFTLQISDLYWCISVFLDSALGVIVLTTF